MIHFDETAGGNGQHLLSHLPLEINDAPRYPYRGFMLDTSRHYFTVDGIKTIIDALALSKFNVLHWHIVDDDSFAMESFAF
jgi:hexosaminidase